MAIKDCFSEYSDYIDNIKNQILKIQLRYNECQSLVSLDYERGILSEDDYDILYNCRMDIYLKGFNSKYILSEEEVNIIKEYADLDKEGKVLSSVLCSKYLRKNDLYQSVFRSVKILAFYSQMDYITRRTKFKEVFLKYYLLRKKKCGEELESLERIYGDKKKNTTKYKSLIAELREINIRISYADSIIKLNDDEFMKAVASFYDVKKPYYEWYYGRLLKEEHDSGFIYGKHEESIDSLRDCYNLVGKVSSEAKEEYTECLGISRDLSDFLTGIIEFDLDELNINEKRSFFGRNKESFNKDILLKVFVELMKIPGVWFYFDNNFEIEENVDVEKLFELYYKKFYGDITYVELASFITKFRKVIVTYYKKILSDYDKILVKRNDTLTEIGNMLDVGINENRMQAHLINEIHNGQKSNSSILNGFTMAESDTMFNCLKAYINNGFSFEESDIIKKKV